MSIRPITSPIPKYNSYVDLVYFHADAALNDMESHRGKPYSPIAREALRSILATHIHGALVDQETEILGLEHSRKEDFVLFTDGSGTTLGNPGGWAAILIRKEEDGRIPYGGGGTQAVWTDYGGYLATTNQRMELAAILHGLESCPSDSSIEVRTDSEWAVRLLTYREDDPSRTVYERRDPWARSACEKIEALCTVKGMRVRFTHVRGHEKDPCPENRYWNGVVDSTAGLGRQQAINGGPHVRDSSGTPVYRPESQRADRT